VQFHTIQPRGFLPLHSAVPNAPGPAFVTARASKPDFKTRRKPEYPDESSLRASESTGCCSIDNRPETYLYDQIAHHNQQLQPSVASSSETSEESEASQVPMANRGPEFLKLEDVRAALSLDNFAGNAFAMRSGRNPIAADESRFYKSALYPIHLSDMTYQDAFGGNQRMAYRRLKSTFPLSFRTDLAVS
jgi:hypothetical protein